MIDCASLSSVIDLSISQDSSCEIFLLILNILKILISNFLNIYPILLEIIFLCVKHRIHFFFRSSK